MRSKTVMEKLMEKHQISYSFLVKSGWLIWTQEATLLKFSHTTCSFTFSRICSKKKKVGEGKANSGDCLAWAAPLTSVSLYKRSCKFLCMNSLNQFTEHCHQFSCVYLTSSVAMVFFHVCRHYFDYCCWSLLHCNI